LIDELAEDVDVVVMLELPGYKYREIEPEEKPARGNGIHDECQS
jgi:hypothetical protein